MKPAQFSYAAPDSLDAVLELMADTTIDSRIIAGGQSLVPMMNFRIATPERLIDLRNVEELNEIVIASDGWLSIGATITQQQLLDPASPARSWPMLVEAAGYIAHPQLRSRGTVCGSLAHHDPIAELPAVAVALSAELTLANSQGRRVVAADDFFVAYYETTIGADELIVNVRFPPRSTTEGSSILEVSRKRGDFALVGAASTIDCAGSGLVQQATLVLFGVADRARRMSLIESQIIGMAMDDKSIEAVTQSIVDHISPAGDQRASAEYRKELAVDLAAATIRQAWERADG